MSQRKPRVLFVGTIFHPAWKLHGGEYRLAFQLRHELTKVGYDVPLLSLQKFMTGRHAHGLVNLAKYLFTEADYSSVKVYIKAIEKLRPDVIMTWYDYDVSCLVASNKLKVPTIVEVQGYWLICPKTNLFNIFYEGPCYGPCGYCGPCAGASICALARLPNRIPNDFWFAVSYPLLKKMERIRKVLTNCTYLVAGSEYIKEKLSQLGCPKEKVKVIYNGVDLERIKPSFPKKEGKLVLFLAGYGFKEKGFEHFISVARSLKPQFPNARFLWLGQSAIRDETFEVRDWVKDESQLYELYEKAYLVMIPSIWPEPMSLTALEAMSHGKPVVAYRTGGIPEAVIQGKSGFLAPLKDAKILTNYVSELLADERLAERLGREARKWVELRFSFKRTMKEYCELINEVVGSGHKK